VKKDVSSIAYSLVPPWSKETMNRMIEKLGREETVKRFSWLLSESEEVIDDLIEQFLTDNFVDDQGTPGGHDFWGEW